MSDGVEFTADDVKYTVETQAAKPGYVWSAPFSSSVEERRYARQVHRSLQAQGPNARFHSLFSVRWNAAWIMPKHIFEKQADLDGLRLQPAGWPGALHPALIRSERRLVTSGKSAPTGTRQRWQSGASPLPSTSSTVRSPLDKRLIEMVNGDLDIHDLTPEGMFNLAKQSPTSRGWFPASLCSSGSDPPDGHLQHPEPDVPG
jgi:peptide/nickel transport system substrate-binding protein